MSLTGCLLKAGDLLNQEDKDAILSRHLELKSGGMTSEDASRQAVSERLQAIQQSPKQSSVTGGALYEKLLSKYGDKAHEKLAALGIQGIDKPGGVAPTRVLGAGTFSSGLNLDVASESAKGVISGVIQSPIAQEAAKAVMPMSTGSDLAKAASQKFANAMRAAKFQFSRINEYLEKTYTPDERAAMWTAADEQNTLMLKGEDTAGKGLETLTPEQRATMNELHGIAQGLWKRAQDAGMVQGEGLPFWTPRMAVVIGEDGEFLRPPSSIKTGAEGKNVTTTAGSLKQRKYVTAEETEAAMKGKLGENAQLVRDVRAMPIAMARLSQAIAGREFVNQIKELGQVAGEEFITNEPKPGFVTIDHPAFNTYRPEFIADAEGKTVPRRDQNGDIVFTKEPMRISKDWEGPVKSVLSSDDGVTYKALMLLKSKAMTAIMVSPLAHNMVIWGRALAYDQAALTFSPSALIENPKTLGVLNAYFSGHALAKDASFMTRAINDGLVPIGGNKSAMLDVTDLARSIGEEGGWGDPNESWLNLSARKVGNFFSDGLGDALKARMDAFGDFWHHTLLWKQVGALQAWIYNDYFNHMIERGHPPEVAGPIAANLANRYAGAVASENSAAWVRKTINVLLFSRSFNVGNIGAIHDAAFGLPAGLRAKMFADAGPEAGEAGLSAAAGKARMGLAADLGASMVLTGITSAAIAKLLLGQSAGDIKEGYERRLQAMWGRVQTDPLNPKSYNPYQILPSIENEPGKEDRIDLGSQPGGRHEYLRLPTGKVVEDTVGWLLHTGDTFGKKLSPLAKGVWEAARNDKGYGVPVMDPHGNVVQNIAQLVAHVVEAQVPWNEMKTLYDVSTGVGTPLDKDKLLGFATGFSISQGNPRGPEEAVFYKQKERVDKQKAYAMEAVKDDLKRGDDLKAYERLQQAGLSPREIAQTINGIKYPRQGMSRPQAKQFFSRATDEDRDALENARR